MKLAEILHSKEQLLKNVQQMGGSTMCLGYALCIYHGQVSYGQLAHAGPAWRDSRMEGIVKRLFPERVAGHYPIVAFNNHPETVWEDVQKAIAEYDREVEAGAPIL